MQVRGPYRADGWAARVLADAERLAVEPAEELETPVLRSAMAALGSVLDEVASGARDVAGDEEARLVRMKELYEILLARAETLRFARAGTLASPPASTPGPPLSPTR